MPRTFAKGLLGLVAFLSAQAASAQSAMPTKAETTLKLGLAAAQRRDWSAALKNFQDALNLAPAATQIVFDLGLANDKMGGHPLAALAWYSAYLALAPNASPPQVRARVAALEAQEGATEHGLIAKAKAVNMQVPGNIQLGGLEQIAGAEAATGHSSAALALLAEAPNEELAGPRCNLPVQMWINNAKGNRDQAYEQLTSVLTKADDLASARVALARITGVNPYIHARSGARLNISEALADTGRYAQAVSFADKLEGVTRESAFEHLADAQFQKGDKSAAKASMDQALNALQRVPCKQFDCLYIGGSLMQSLNNIEGLAAVRHLYGRLLHKSPGHNAFSMNVLKEDYASVLATAGQIAEAKATAAGITDGNKPGSMHTLALSAIAYATTTQTNAKINALNSRLGGARDLAALKDAVATAALPVTLQTFPTWLRIAQLYRGFGDLADAEHEVAVLKSALARLPPTLDRASSQLELAQLYVRMERNSEAAGIVSHLVLAPFLPALLRKQDPYHQAQGLAGALASLAALEVKNGDLRNAKISAGKALAIVSQLKSADTGVFVLETVCADAPDLALTGTCQRLEARLPPGGSSNALYGDLVTGYGLRLKGAHQQATIDKIDQFASKITDLQQRANALQPIIEKLAAVKDWHDATSLATGSPALIGALAQQMMASGALAEARALGPLLAGDAQQLGAYQTNLALHLAEDGDIPGAIAAIKQLSTPHDPIVSYYQIAQTAFAWGGPDAKLAASTADSAFARFYARPHFGCWSWPQITPSSEPAWNRADLTPVMKKCLAQRADWMLFNTQWRCCRVAPDMPAPLRHAYQEWRYWEDRDVLAKVGSANTSDREAADHAEIYTLYGDGAIELANTQFTSHINDIASDAAQRLGEDNPAEARALASRMIARAGTLTSSYAKSQMTVHAIEALVAAGDLTAALALLQQIADQDDYLTALRSVSVLAQQQDPGAARALLTQEVQLDHVHAQDYYLSDIARRAAELGLHHVAKIALARYEAAEPQSWCDTDYGYIDGLLRQGDRTRAAAKLETALPRLALLAPSGRATCAPKLATALAWAGQNDQLATLLAEAPDAALLSRELKAAAKGSARAGDADAAHQFLARALAARKVKRSDVDGWSAAVIAEAQDAVNPSGAAQGALAIPDPTWRARAIATIAGQRFAAADMAGAATLLETSNPLRDKVLDMALARAARWLYGQQHDKRGQALIGRISARTLREATWHFCILTRARLQRSADPFKNSDEITNVSEKAYLLIDLHALLRAQGRNDLAHEALQRAQALMGGITDPLVQADVADWIARAADAHHPQFMKAAKATAAALATRLPDPSARADMQTLASATLDLSQPAAPDSALQAKAAQAALAKKVESDAYQFAASLNYPPDLGDIETYLRAMASKNPDEVVGLLTQAATDRAAKLASLEALVKTWRPASPRSKPD